MKIYVYINGTPHNLIGDISDNGTPLFSGGEDAELPIADSSYRFSEIMGDDNVVVNFSMPVFYEFPIGCRINVDFIEYTLLELGQVTKQNERWYDYTLTFESPAKTLSCYKFRNHVDGRLNFTLTAQPQEFLDHICKNMNMREGSNEWTVGDCIVSSEKTQSFSHNSVLDALNSIALLFETEWEIIGKRISLREIEYNKTNPINLSYGKGNGFKSGISRQLSGEKAVDVLWVEGSDRNIDGRKYTYRKDGQSYHANKLRLPRNSRWVFVPSDGTVDLNGKVARGTLFTRTEWNNKTEAEKAAYGEFMAVKTDKDGFGVERESRINNGYEESVDLPDIYPHKVLQVAQADLVNRDNRFWDIKATTADGSAIPNYNDCLIGGVDVTIIFNTGMLTGKEFNLANQGTENNPKCYNPETRVFKIQPAEIDGITMPDLPLTDPEGTGYVPAVGDEFGVFHVQLPQEYIEEAERELLLTACEYLHKHGEVEVEFNGTVDGIWAKQNWADISPFIKVGGYVRFTDTKLVTEGKLMRILSIKNYLNNPHSPEITLSNSSVSQTVSSELKKIPQNQVFAMAEIDKQVAYTQRSFRDTKDTQKALEEAFVNQGEYFSESITPASVETMQMIVGSEDLQFMFGSADYTIASNRKKVTRFDEFNYSPNFANGKLTCTKVQMRHYSYTANKNTISPTANTVASFPYWEIAARTFTPSNPNQTYYLYAVCAKSATNANNLGYITEGAGFTLEAAPHAHTEQSFYFMVGILNREKDGTRSFATVYGHSEVLGNRITTGRIVSADGQTWFDLTTGEIRTNKSIKFSWQGSQQDLADAMSRVNNNASNANALAGAVQTNLDNLQIGGRNLFGLYSDCGTTLEGFPNRANVTLDTTNKCAKMVGAADRACYFYSKIPFYPTPNKVMTISCDVKIENIVDRKNSSYPFMCEVYASGQYVGSTWYGAYATATYLDGVKISKVSKRFSDVITDTKWHRFACVWKYYNVAYTSNLPPAIYLRGATGTLWVKNVKYEEGDHPTAWTPAPEDMATDLANVEDTAVYAQRLSDAVQLVSSGYMMYRDPEFTQGVNNIKVYNNSGGGTVTHARITDSTAPNAAQPPNNAHYVIRITTNGTASPYCGGFYFGNMSRANAVFVYHIKAKIPKGYYIEYAHNAFGNNPQKVWATPQVGDGTWREYVQISRCGSSGSFSSIGFFYLIPQSGYSATSVTWYVAYATCYDCSAHECLKQAFANSTDITGGVVLSNIIQVRNNNGTITAGMSGMNPNSKGSNPRFWAGGDFAAAQSAAAQAISDIPQTSLPILLLDDGYNSNIGIFKVLPEAIAVMRAGQVIRISAKDFTTEYNSFSPSPPYTRSLSAGVKLVMDTIPFTESDTNSIGTSIEGGYYIKSHTRSIGTFSKDGTYNISVAAAKVALSLWEEVEAQTNGACTVGLGLRLVVVINGTSHIILHTKTHSTINSCVEKGIYTFSSSQTPMTSALTLKNITAKAGSVISLSAELYTSIILSQRPINRYNYYKLMSPLSVTMSEVKSCFVLAKGGFACATAGDKSLIYDAINGSLDYHGTAFKINNADYGKVASHTVSLGSSRYISLNRIGNLVMCKIASLTKSYLNTNYIPTGYRPFANCDFLGYSENTNDVVYSATITTSGAVQCSALPNNTVLWGMATYICTEPYP